MRARLARFALVAGTVMAATLGTTAEAQALPTCASNRICLWQGENGTGALYTWSGNYHDLPSGWVDHVGSYRANRAGAFIDWANGKECHAVPKGFYSAYYLSKFGGKMDAVGDTC